LFEKSSMYMIPMLCLAVLAIPVSSRPAPLAGAPENACVECHLQVGDALAEPVNKMKGDIHDSRGVTCEGCHRGNPNTMDMEKAMNPDDGFIGVPEGEQRVEMCARCHGDAEFMKKYNPSIEVDQAELYWTSIHGKRLREGDASPAACADCHGYHQVYAHDDSRSKVYPTNVVKTCGNCHADPEYMEKYGIPTDQVEQYGQSVHARKLFEDGDLSSPACNDCHGNHGAVPPGVENLAYVCSKCHPVQQELFADSPHGRALKEYGMPSCDDCHRHHKILSPSDDMIGVGDDAVCVGCHDRGGEGYRVAEIVSGHLERVKKEINRAEELLDRAEEHGMPSVDARYELSQAKSLLVKSRTVVHTFTLSRMEEPIVKATDKARSAQQAAREFFDELGYRKAGLWATWIFIILFSIGIVLKIRGLKNNSRNRSPKDIDPS